MLIFRLSITLGAFLTSDYAVPRQCWLFDCSTPKIREATKRNVQRQTENTTSQMWRFFRQISEYPSATRYHWRATHNGPLCREYSVDKAPPAMNAKIDIENCNLGCGCIWLKPSKKECRVHPTPKRRVYACNSEARTVERIVSPVVASKREWRGGGQYCKNPYQTNGAPGTRGRAGKSCGRASAYRHEALAMPGVQPLPIGVCGQRGVSEARHLLSA